MLKMLLPYFFQRFDGWGINDCERTEAAGVQCKQRPPPTSPPPTTTTPRPKALIHQKHKDEFEIRLFGGRTKMEGNCQALTLNKKKLNLQIHLCRSS